MNRPMRYVFWTLMMLVSLTSALAQESGWPRTLPLEQGMVTIYSLQVDEMSGDVIHFRAALAYRETAGSEPVFGAGWFESRVEIDQSSRIVHPVDLKVTDTRFPDDMVDVHSELSVALAQQSPVWNLDFSLDELEAGLKTAAAEAEAAGKLNTSPPEIIYRDHPALLISLDGEPILREIENSPYEAVINTPYPLIFDGRQYYLNAARDVWYRAGKATGPYRFDENPPTDIAAMVTEEDAGAEDDPPAESVTAANAPEIVVTTRPAELIVTEGPAAFVPLVDDLLVLNNSESDVFMHVSEQKYFIVLAGRWYQAPSLNGPWSYQPADELPETFARIPRDSKQADSRVYVAGTEEAQEAVLDAQVPIAKAVTRGEAQVDVVYDGDPVYQAVDGTDLVYIENTGSTVLKSSGWYYLVEDGVWYVSSSPNGPWQVSDHRPVQVDTILPTSPVYNVKYVRVYDSTPSVVYVGYTPGYYGSYVYRNTIFYGSGWYYSPWVSPYYYYPRYSTWGFNVSYNPWSGWGFGLSWGWGPFYVGYYSGGYWHRNHYWHHPHYGYWGPRGYRPRPAHYGRRGDGHRRYADNGYGRGGHDDNYGRGGRDNGNRRGGSDNGYGRGGHGNEGRVQPADLRRKADVRDINTRARKNNLLADNNGRVYQDSGRGGSRQEIASRNKNTSIRTTQPTTGTTSRQSEAGAEDNQARRRPSEASKTPSDRPVQPARGGGSTRPGNNSERPAGDSTSGRNGGERPASNSTRPGGASDRAAGNSSRLINFSDRTADSNTRSRGGNERPASNSSRPGGASDRAAGNSSRLISINDRTEGSTSRSRDSSERPTSTNTRPVSSGASQRTPRLVTAPTPRQNSPRPESQSQRPSGPATAGPAPAQRAPQVSRNSGRSDAPQSRQAPQRSSKGGQRSSSESVSSKRSSGNRSRHQ